MLIGESVTINLPDVTSAGASIVDTQIDRPLAFPSLKTKPSELPLPLRSSTSSTRVGHIVRLYAFRGVGNGLDVLPEPGPILV